ncbi:MAG: hypothetical protein Q9181_002401 [Wetmoreana brouardii]
MKPTFRPLNKDVVITDIPLAALKSSLATITTLHKLLIQQEAEGDREGWTTTCEHFEVAHHRFKEAAIEFVESPLPIVATKTYQLTSSQHLALRNVYHALANPKDELQEALSN